MSVSLEGRKGLSHPFLIRKLSIFFPFFRAATIHLGLCPLPAQVPPDGLRYFGGTFLPFNDELPEALPFIDLAPPNAANCFSSSERNSSNVCQLDLVGSSEPQRSFP